MKAVIVTLSTNSKSFAAVTGMIGKIKCPHLCRSRSVDSKHAIGLTTKPMELQKFMIAFGTGGHTALSFFPASDSVLLITGKYFAGLRVN